ncbi:MAG TPA: hypothetical protein VJ020_03190 [Anaerolineales bacterium]|nr:hypothetical protein [Anaerolineales bacterium]
MTLTRTTFFNRPAFKLSNESLSLTLVPAFSGRVMELIADGVNYFWVNEPLLRGEIGGDPTFGNWLNWGGYKTWLAPQSRWPNPVEQSDERDNVEWEVIDQSATEIELRGPVIAWSGVRLERRLALATGEPQVRVLESITNESAAPRTWALWAVAQFPVPGWATYPPAGERKTLVPPIHEFDGDCLRYIGGAKWKVGALTPNGWGEYRADPWPRTLRAGFAVHPGRPHPDDCNLETWSNSDPDYMELEWLGPLVTLQPGESWTFETEWSLAPPSPDVSSGEGGG